IQVKKGDHDELLSKLCTIYYSYFSLLLYRYSHIKKSIESWQALIIGFTVVSLGALTEYLGAPIWLIVLIPFPVGMLLLFLFLQQPLQIWFIAYITVLALYTIIH